MQTQLKRILIAATAMSLSVVAMAADVTGKWNGKMNVDLSKTKAYMLKQNKANPKAADSISKGIDGQQSALNSATIKLEIIKGGTFKLVQTAGGKTETETGKWTVTGDKIKFTGLSSKNGGPTELNGTVSKNGKNILIDLTTEMRKQMAKAKIPAEGMGKGSISFTKA
jgi:hypothetical protein